MSSALPPAIDVGAVGAKVDGAVYLVTSDEIAAYAAATDDRTPECSAGRIAPPVYAINPVLETMVSAKKKVTEAFGFHGEHDFRFHVPLRAGMKVAPQAEVVAIQQRSSGVTIRIHIVSQADGAIVNEQEFVSFIPKARIERSVGAPSPTAQFTPRGEPFATSVSPLAPDQTLRYAAASNDHDAYTTDIEVARQMGFPGLVVHGTLTIALSSGAVVRHGCGGDPRRLRRLAVRLAKPLYLTDGEELTTRIWRADTGENGAFSRLCFQAHNRGGETILANGLAEISDG